MIRVKVITPSAIRELHFDSKASVKVGESINVRIGKSPSKAPVKKVTWKVRPLTYAGETVEVDPDGLKATIKGLKPGASMVDIDVTDAYGKVHIAYIEVTVY